MIIIMNMKTAEAIVTNILHRFYFNFLFVVTDFQPKDSGKSTNTSKLKSKGNVFNFLFPLNTFPLIQRGAGAEMSTNENLLNILDLGNVKQSKVFFI